MKRRIKGLGCAVVGACAAFAVGDTSYTWDAGGSQDYWEQNGNWDISGYPSTTSHDATVVTVGGWSHDLNLSSNKTIDDLIVTTDVDFGDWVGSGPTLSVDTFSISAESGGSIVTVSEMTIVTH